MATRLLFCGFCRKARRSQTQLRRQSGATLLELIIVLFIIGVMASMLFPAIQAARSKANVVACQNNVRQVGMAMSRCISALRRFPAPNRWTVDILKWMEEEPLANEVAHGIPPNAQLPRPQLFRCAGQPEVSSTVANVLVCHYVLAVDRPIPVDKRDHVAWEIHDRPILSDQDILEPWYVGPEISFAQQQEMFATMRGPHPAGQFFTSGGGVRGGN